MYQVGTAVLIMWMPFFGAAKGLFSVSKQIAEFP